MAANDESELDDAIRRVGRARERESVPSGVPPGDHREPPDSYQLSARDLAVLLGYTLPAGSADDCPTLVRLNDILENSDTASTDELRHIRMCTDCASRVRGFRNTRRDEAIELFEGRVALIRDAHGPFVPIVQEAEGHARLLFLMIGQDADPDRWQIEAWSCTRKVAAALRLARNNGAKLPDRETILELFMTAIGCGASNPVATCSRVADGSWPIVEMVKHTAIHVALTDPGLFKAFSRQLGAVVRMATRRMKAMLAYTMVGLLDDGILPPAFAPILVREISASDLADAVRVVVATLLDEHRDLPADLRSAVADAWSDPRVEDTFRSVARGRHAVQTALVALRNSRDHEFEAVLDIFRRFADDLFAAVEPEDSMLRLIALRPVLREMARTDLPHDDAVALFRFTAELLLERANRRTGSTFFAMEAWSLIRRVCPLAFGALIETFASAPFAVRQGIISSIADGYAASYQGNRQEAVPRFQRRRNSSWEFEEGTLDVPLDAFTRRIAQITPSAALQEHLHWLRKRLEIWESAELPVITL